MESEYNSQSSSHDTDEYGRSYAEEGGRRRERIRQTFTQQNEQEIADEEYKNEMEMENLPKKPQPRRNTRVRSRPISAKRANQPSESRNISRKNSKQLTADNPESLDNIIRHTSSFDSHSSSFPHPQPLNSYEDVGADNFGEITSPTPEKRQSPRTLPPISRQSTVLSNTSPLQNSVHFGNTYGTNNFMPQDLYQPNEFNNVYAENATTGKFIRVTKTQSDRNNEKREEPDLRPDIFRNFVDFVNAIIATLFVLCQGLLGGISFILFFLTYVSNNTTTFLKYYSRVASAVQHIFFVFTTIALLAAFDKIAKDKLQGWNVRMDGRKQKLLDGALIACYAIAFISSLINAQMDDIIYYSEARQPGWYEQALDSSFKSQLNQWHAFNILRIFGSMIGWFLVSLEVRPYQFDPPVYYEDEQQEELIMVPEQNNNVTTTQNVYSKQ